MNVPNKVRIDKWLWSIRLYKTRTLASNACRAGRVKIESKSVKASYLIEEGTLVSIKQRDKSWNVKAIKLIEKRVGAAIAVTCYEDLSPPQETPNKAPSFFHSLPERRERGTGRPTKKDRREIDEFKDQPEES